ETGVELRIFVLFCDSSEVVHATRRSLLFVNAKENSSPPCGLYPNCRMSISTSGWSRLGSGSIAGEFVCPPTDGTATRKNPAANSAIPFGLWPAVMFTPESLRSREYQSSLNANIDSLTGAHTLKTRGILVST